MAVVGAALASVGAAMLVLGVLDAMGIMRLMGTSPAFLGVCMLFVGGLLILVTRAESVGDEDDAASAGHGAGNGAVAAGRAGAFDPVADDIIDPDYTGVAGRVAPGGTVRPDRPAARPVASRSLPPGTSASAGDQPPTGEPHFTRRRRR